MSWPYGSEIEIFRIKNHLFLDVPLSVVDVIGYMP